jgi:hypothetical protein
MARGPSNESHLRIIEDARACMKGRWRVLPATVQRVLEPGERGAQDGTLHTKDSSEDGQVCLALSEAEGKAKGGNLTVWRSSGLAF